MVKGVQVAAFGADGDTPRTGLVGDKELRVKVIGGFGFGRQVYGIVFYTVRTRIL